jgi:hypothetical protein
MLTSAKRRLALPMLAALFVTLSGAPAPAQSAGALAERAKPGQVMETIAPAATVVSTVHYQAELGLSCSGSQCFGAFPKLGENRRLTVTRITCYLQGGSDSTFYFGSISVVAATTVLLSEFLPEDYSNSIGVHIFNRAVDVQVASGQYIYVASSVVNGDYAESTTCSVAGTLDRLQ